MSLRLSNDGSIRKANSAEKVSNSENTTSGSNILSSLIKKAPYAAVSPGLRRRSGKKDDVGNHRSAVSQMLHSVPDAVKKKFGRGTNSPDLGSTDGDFEDGNFQNVLEQISTGDTPLLRSWTVDEDLPLTLLVEPDSMNVESDDENTEHDGLISTIFSQLSTVPAIENEMLKVKSEIEVTQRNSIELTKKYLESSKTLTDSQIPDLVTRETYNQKNLKAQKHVRSLQKRLGNLDERYRRMREQEAMNSLNENEHEKTERQRTPDFKKASVTAIQGLVKKGAAVSRGRRKTRPIGTEEKPYGSDSAIDSVGSESREAVEAFLAGSLQSDPRSKHRESEPSLSELVRSEGFENQSEEDKYDGIPGTDDSENHILDGGETVSNLSESLIENINALREDFQKLRSSEMRELRETMKDNLLQSSFNRASQGKEQEYLIAALQDFNSKLRHLEDRVEDKLDKFSYSSEERLKEIEERLENYRYRMTRYEEMQEQRRMEGPMAGNDITSRGRDVMSSCISLGLALVSFLLFLFTTLVDCLKVFGQNNAISTALSIGLFGLIISLYYYFDVGQT